MAYPTYIPQPPIYSTSSTLSTSAVSVAAFSSSSTSTCILSTPSANSIIQPIYTPSPYLTYTPIADATASSAPSESYTTRTVAALTTHCPAPTHLTIGDTTYIITTSTTLTITECRDGCIITEPVTPTSSSTAAALPVGDVFLTASASSSQVPPYPYPSGATAPSGYYPTGTGGVASSTSYVPPSHVSQGAGAPTYPAFNAAAGTKGGVGKVFVGVIGLVGLWMIM